jgi:hypothetical protein
MRTFKALLGVAALAAGIATSMAQSNVYSLNVVGYYNLTVGSHQQVMIANQLNTTNNTIGALLTPPMVANNDIIYKFNGGFSLSQYSTDDGQWDPDPTVTLNPGEAVFYKNAQASTETLTFVGEVLQGQLVNTLPLGVQVMRSSMVPQQGLVSTDLGVPYDNNDLLYVYNTLQNSGGYSLYQYSTDDGQWDPSEPTIAVGQGFFYKKASTANPANANWVRNFTVQ